MENERIWTLITRKLSGAATATELRELEELTAKDPACQKTVSSISALWSSGTATDADFLEATYLQHLERMKTRGFSISSDDKILDEGPSHLDDGRHGSPRTPGRKQILVSALLVVLLISTWWIIKKPGETLQLPAKPEMGVVSTGKGSRTKLILPDGTSVWLNAGSSLSYSKKFDTGPRIVTLRGEAFFDVVKNKERPFIIHTATMDVKVMGTQFNVKAYEEDKTSETSLIHGSVEVYLHSRPEKKYLLKPNEKLVLSQLSQMQLADQKGEKQDSLPLIEIRQLTYQEGTKADIESSWTRNILSFKDEPFSEVSKKLERWYDVQFEFKNKRWEDEFLSGSFEKESLEQAMTALRFSTGFNFKINDKKILIY